MKYVGARIDVDGEFPSFFSRKFLRGYAEGGDERIQHGHRNERAGWPERQHSASLRRRR